MIGMEITMSIELFARVGAPEQIFVPGLAVDENTTLNPEGYATVCLQSSLGPAHLVIWLAPNEKLSEMVEVFGFNYNLRYLTRSSKLLVVKTMATNEGDLEPRICEVRPALSLVVMDDEPGEQGEVDFVQWHVELLRDVQNDAGQAPAERLAVVARASQSRTFVQGGGETVL